MSGLGGGDDERLARILAAVEAQGAKLEALSERVGPARARRALLLRGLFDLFAKAHGPPSPGAPPKHKSWATMRNRLKPVIDYFGDEPAEALTPARWPAYVEKRLGDPVPYIGKDDPKPDGIPSSKPVKFTSQLTINHELGWTKRLYSFGMQPEIDAVKVNPFATVKRTKCRKRRETWITEEDVQNMLTSYRPRLEHAGIIMRAFLLLMVDQGFRFNEARKMRRDRMRVHDGHVVVDVGRTKNGTIHYRALTGRSVAALEEVLQVVGSPLFFVNGNRTRKDGTPVLKLYSERHMRRWFRDMCEAARVDVRVAEGDVRVRPHDIRHSAATLALLRGAGLPAIQAMLNHSSLAVTEGYLHGLDLEGAVEMAKRMENGAAIERANAEERRRGPKRASEIRPDRSVTEK